MEKRAHNFHDLTGKRFGRLTVLGIDRVREYIDKKRNHKKRRIVWNCICDCGNRKTNETYHLVTGTSKSCGCLKHEGTAGRNTLLKRLPAGVSAMRGLMKRYQQGATKRNLEWSLSESEFKDITSNDCFYCGEKPKQIAPGHWSNYPYNGIDRLENSIGYTKENCVTSCGKCNLMKMDLSYSEFVSVVERIYEIHVKKNADFSSGSDPRKSHIERNHYNKAKKIGV